MKTKLIIVSLFSLFIFSCDGDENSKMERKGFEKATVINLALDGCDYVIQLESGEKLEPVNIEDNFQADGLEIWIKYKKEKSKMGACMVGPLINIEEIQVR